MRELRLNLVQAHLFLQRFGFANSFGVVLFIVGTFGWQIGLPRLATSEWEQQQQIIKLTQALTIIEPPAYSSTDKDRQKTEFFYSQLGNPAHVEQEIKTILALANKNGLLIQQADYQFGVIKNGQIATYQVHTPVKGTYPAIRQFCEQFLLTTPFASLDNLSFKRDTITNNIVETRLQFTLYLNQTPAKKSGEM